MIFEEIDAKIKEAFDDHPLVHVEPEMAEYVFLEYVLFSHKAFGLLSSALVSVVDYPLLQIEVQENVQEELGYLSQGVPHLVTLRDGMCDLGLEADSMLSKNGDTEIFLRNMSNLFTYGSKGQVAGALYALEASAVPEFRGLKVLIKKMCQHRSITVPKALRRYVDYHLVAEENHALGIKKAILPYITDENKEEMLIGAYKVINQMKHWLNEITDEGRSE